MNFRTTLGKSRHLSVNFNFFLANPQKKYFSKNFRKKISEFSVNFRHSWSRHPINSVVTGVAHAVPEFISPWSVHTALTSSGCMKHLGLYERPQAVQKTSGRMKDLGLANPGMALAPG